jgi:hypothetical protein
MRVLIFAALLFLASRPLAAEEVDDRFDCNPRDDRQLCEMYRADQEARKPPIVDLAKLENPAATSATRNLVDREVLRTGNDYFRAATLLLHSSKPEDYLLSHIISIRGLMQAPRHPRVRLLAALSLDRFLVVRNKQQIFGTQTMGSDEKGPRWYPYDCILGSRLRTVFLGDYPEPCRRRADRLAAVFSKVTSLLAPTPRTQLTDYIRSAEQLLKSPASRAARKRTAASLDAYLLATGERQVFGTQAQRQRSRAQLDCELLSASIRNAFSVAGPCDRSERTASTFTVR